MVEQTKRRATDVEFLTACYFAEKHPSEVLEVWVTDDRKYEVVLKASIEKVTINVTYTGTGEDT